MITPLDPIEVPWHHLQVEYKVYSDPEKFWNNLWPCNTAKIRLPDGWYLIEASKLGHGHTLKFDVYSVFTMEDAEKVKEILKGIEGV
jgi:hypothetical protein